MALDAELVSGAASLPIAINISTITAQQNSRRLHRGAKTL